MPLRRSDVQAFKVRSPSTSADDDKAEEDDKDDEDEDNEDNDKDGTSELGLQSNDALGFERYWPSALLVLAADGPALGKAPKRATLGYFANAVWFVISHG
jgi:hypothetical protein